MNSDNRKEDHHCIVLSFVLYVVVVENKLRKGMMILDIFMVCAKKGSGGKTAARTFPQKHPF